MFRFVFFLLLTGSLLLIDCSGGKKNAFDIVIKGGNIVDGSGRPMFKGDIGIRGDTIVEIGDLSVKDANTIIEAEGLTVTPGFIDIHNHSDWSFGRSQTNQNLNFLTQGVATVVVGNCGSGTFNIAETKAKWEKQGLGTNVVMLIGHGTLRESVMGTKPVAPKPEELKEMKAIVEMAMQEGAWGISTGLEFVPGRYADTDELIELAEIVGKFNGLYCSHQRSETEDVMSAVQETIRICEEAKVRVNTSHLKVCGKSNWGLMDEIVALIENARNKGLRFTADMYPYDKAESHPAFHYIEIPEDMELLLASKKKVVAESVSRTVRNKLEKTYVEMLRNALLDVSQRARIEQMTNFGLRHTPSPAAIWGWDSFAVVHAEKNSHLIDKIISDIAVEQNSTPFDIVADLFIEEGKDIILSEGVMSEKEMKYAMRQNWLMFSSDGNALDLNPDHVVHPRNYGSFPRVIRKYVREETVLSLEEAIRKITHLPACVLQINNRGLLKKGYKADVTVFDFEAIQDNATFFKPHVYADGIKYLIVNGKITIENGIYNQNLPGTVLKPERE